MPGRFFAEMGWMERDFCDTMRKSWTGSGRIPRRADTRSILFYAIGCDAIKNIIISSLRFVEILR